MIQTLLDDLPVWIAAATFALAFPALSYVIQSRFCSMPLERDVGQIALLAALTFAAAIVCEAVVNPMYAAAFGEKLWEYRQLPLHDSNVSALSVLIWSSYGVHLYFVDQTLDRWFAHRSRRRLLKACIVGVEAPLIWEVCGNAVFLALLGDYYAYYLPGELAHFTSVRVIPVYIVCVYVGLLIYERLRCQAHVIRIAALCFVGGASFLALG